MIGTRKFVLFKILIHNSGCIPVFPFCHFCLLYKFLSQSKESFNLNVSWILNYIVVPAVLWSRDSHEHCGGPQPPQNATCLCTLWTCISSFLFVSCQMEWVWVQYIFLCYWHLFYVVRCVKVSITFLEYFGFKSRLLKCVHQIWRVFQNLPLHSADILGLQLCLCAPPCLEGVVLGRGTLLKSSWIKLNLWLLKPLSFPNFQNHFFLLCVYYMKSALPWHTAVHHQKRSPCLLNCQTCSRLFLLLGIANCGVGFTFCLGQLPCFLEHLLWGYFS